MGVLSCDRKDCANIMCDRFSYSRNEYICDRCFNELVALGPATNIDNFMNSSPSNLDLTEESKIYFDRIFPRSP